MNTSKALKLAVRGAKARRRAARKQRESFPYEQVAKLWDRGKTIAFIANAIDRVDKRDPNGDPFHSLRNFLYRMHRGYRNDKGKLIKLPYRVGRSAIQASRKAGIHGMVVKRQLARGQRAA
jgi:hypothetical protein